MRILDLFSGIGGVAIGLQRWLDEHNIDYGYYAVDISEDVLTIHSRLNPNSITILRDAYTIDDFSRYDFIWASPPCQTHSRINKLRGRDNPDMRLYDLIAKLRDNGKPFVVENVIPYYKPPIQWNYIIDRHVFWTNLYIGNVPIKKKPKTLPYMTLKDLSEYHGVPLEVFDGMRGINKIQMLRNMVNPDMVYNMAKYIFPQVLGMNMGLERWLHK